MKTRIALIGALFICIVSFIASSRTPEKPAEIPELLRSELTLIDGRLHQSARPEPFDGWMIERHSNSELRSRSRVMAGLLNGVSEGWNEAGQLIVQEHFVNGVSHGIRTKWHPNGAKLSEATIENGKVAGEFRRWHENGELSELLHLKDGGPEGESWAFYPSGYARAMARHENGALVHRETWQDGERKMAFAEHR